MSLVDYPAHRVQVINTFCSSPSSSSIYNKALPFSSSSPAVGQPGPTSVCCTRQQPASPCSGRGVRPPRFPSPPNVGYRKAKDAEGVVLLQATCLETLRRQFRSESIKERTA